VANDAQAFKTLPHPYAKELFMSQKVATKIATNKPTSSRMIKRLVEQLMVKTGIKAGPEFTSH
jgi:hypothetical protein